MSDENQLDDTVAEETKRIAPGIAMAYGELIVEEEENDGGRKRLGDHIIALRDWEPQTRLGRMVHTGQVVTYEEAVATGLPVREVQIVDALLPELTDDIINVNMVQRMTDSGRRVRFNVMACVGNKDGIVGLSTGKAKEVAIAIQKAISSAKLNLIQIQRGNGSWESGSGPGTSIPFKVVGNSGSTRLTLMPAPAGKGLVVGPIGRRVLELAGITDIWSRSKGQTRTTINYAQATFNALQMINLAKISMSQRHDHFIISGRVFK